VTVGERDVATEPDRRVSIGLYSSGDWTLCGLSVMALDAHSIGVLNSLLGGIFLHGRMILYLMLFVCYLRIENAEGYVLIAVYLFIYLFVCVLLA